MDASIPKDAKSDGRSSRRKVLYTGLGIIVGLFFINDILGLINGGGVFSIISDVKAVQRGARLVDVDDAGLRILFVAGCSLAGTAVAVALKADIDKRLTSAVFVLSIIGGGFVLDAIYDPNIAKRYMTDHSYIRCQALDHVRGHGKGSVWFKGYVLNGADCPAKQPS